MARAVIDGLTIGYEVIGEGRPWAITPGGRFSKDSPGVRELAQALAARGNRVVIWDRPNCGESDVCFTGESESADAGRRARRPAARTSDMAPAIIAGGSGGSRVSLLTAARHREVAAGLAVWWITGGPFGLLSLANHYCGGSIRAAWTGGMADVAALDEWAEVLERNPANRQRFLDQDPRGVHRHPRALDARVLPARRRGRSPACPTTRPAASTCRRWCSAAARATPTTPGPPPSGWPSMLPKARLVEPPWGDREWIERQAARPGGGGEGLFVRWPLLVPQLLGRGRTRPSVTRSVRRARPSAAGRSAARRSWATRPSALRARSSCIGASRSSASIS